MQRTTGPYVRLRTDQLRQRTTALGLSRDSAIAAHLGLSQATVMRLLAGTTTPGESTIAAVLTTFPDARFEDLFEVVTDREPARASVA